MEQSFRVCDYKATQREIEWRGVANVLLTKLLGSQKWKKKNHIAMP